MLNAVASAFPIYMCDRVKAHAMWDITEIICDQEKYTEKKFC